MPPEYSPEREEAARQEAVQRYNLPPETTIDEASVIVTERRRKKWAVELGLPEDTPLEAIKAEQRRRHDTEKSKPPAESEDARAA